MSLLVIGPTYEMAYDACKVFGISPRLHAVGAEIPLTLAGRRELVLIKVGRSEAWYELVEPHILRSLSDQIEAHNATVVHVEEWR